MIPNKHSLLHHQTEQAKRRRKNIFYEISSYFAAVILVSLVFFAGFFVCIWFTSIVSVEWYIFSAVLLVVAVFVAAHFPWGWSSESRNPAGGGANPSNDAYTQLTELSDMLENRDVPDKEVLRIIDEVREKMRKDARHNAWMDSEHRKKLIEAADRCKPIFDRALGDDRA